MVVLLESTLFFVKFGSWHENQIALQLLGYEGVWQIVYLGTPNQRCTPPGPGIGEGGDPDMPGANCVPQGNVLIIQEDNPGKNDIPDDNMNGGVVMFDFSSNVKSVNEIGLLDVDYATSITVYHDVSEVTVIKVDQLGDNSFQTVPINLGNVTAMALNLTRSGAVSFVDLCFDPTIDTLPPSSPTSPPTSPGATAEPTPPPTPTTTEPTSPPNGQEATAEPTSPPTTATAGPTPFPSPGPSTAPVDSEADPKADNETDPTPGPTPDSGTEPPVKPLPAPPNFVCNRDFSQVGNDIYGEAGVDAYIGSTVALSSDGRTVAVGGTRNDGYGGYSGHVRVFRSDGSSWTQVGDDIFDEVIGDEIIRPVHLSLSLSSDGNVVAIGSPFNPSNGIRAGQVRVLRLEGTTWIQLGGDISGEKEFDNFGKSVCMSSDGSAVVVGAPYNDGNGKGSGHVRVFKFDGTTWNQLGSNILGKAAQDLSGDSVSISGDGNIVAIGSPSNDGNGFRSGHVRVFKWEGTAWTQLGGDIGGEAEQDSSGKSVSISSDGNTVSIGAPYNGGNGNVSGHVRVFRWEGTAWAQLGEDIDSEKACDESGFSVSLSSDGSKCCYWCSSQ